MPKRKITAKGLPKYCKRHDDDGSIWYYRPKHPSVRIPFEPGTAEFKAAYVMAERCARGWVKRIQRAHREFESEIRVR